MSLSTDLISQFVKVTKDTPEPKKETTVYGTVIQEGGKTYVQLDGATAKTPVSNTANVGSGDRVIVMIKNHSAVITGNLTSPAARVIRNEDGTTTVENVDIDIDKITELSRLVADKASIGELEVQVGRIDNLRTENAEIRGLLNADEAKIDELIAKDAVIEGNLQVANGEIDSLKTSKLDAGIAEAKFAEIENLKATKAEVYDLEATHAEFKQTTVSNLEAAAAAIRELDAKKLSSESAAITYANIDFSNIGKAAIGQFFSKSGLIENLVVGDGMITGELVGVTIKGDLIEGNTVKAEKLVVKGSDGLYYKLNIDAGATTSEKVSKEDLQDGLHGTVIIAKTITAEKISVGDLVAFDATIGGFHITENSIYSGAKGAADNTTRGIYLDSDGQMAIGDETNFLRYYRNSESNDVLNVEATATISEGVLNVAATATISEGVLNVEATATTGNYVLEISASSILFGTGSKSVETVIDEVQSLAELTEEKTNSNESLIRLLSENIAMLVTDGNGTSLMTQTEDGWMFSTSDIQKLVDTTSENLDALTNELKSTNNVVDVLYQAVADLGTIAEYVKIGTYEDEPCIELGESDSDFKLLITNTRIMFMEGSGVPAYFTNQSMHIKKAVIEEELQQGGFVWKSRSNGNLGLVWKGVSN